MNKLNLRKIGEIAGYSSMFIIFSIVLFFVLGFFNNLPNSWGYPHVAFLTLTIVLFGTLIKMVLQ